MAPLTMTLRRGRNSRREGTLIVRLRLMLQARYVIPSGHVLAELMSFQSFGNAHTLSIKVDTETTTTRDIEGHDVKVSFETHPLGSYDRSLTGAVLMKNAGSFVSM